MNSEKLILILSWHPGDTRIQTAGGFKRLYEILKRAKQKALVIDKYPSIYKDLQSEYVQVVEYKIPAILKIFNLVSPILFKLVERLVTAPLVVIKAIVIGSKFDIIYVPYSELPQLSLAGVILKILMSSRLVLCNLNVNTLWVDRLLNKFLHSLSDQTITISQALRQDLSQSGINAHCVNGVGFDPSPFDKLWDLPHEYDCIFVGRHTITKGILDLIEAVRMINQSSGKKLTIATVGDQPPDVKGLISRKLKEYNLESSFKLLGNLAEEEKIAAYHRSKLCAFPSHQEGWGIVPLEALASGLPVVLYDLEVYKESVGFCEAVLYVKEGDIQAFADGIQKLLVDAGGIRSKAKDCLKAASWDDVATREFELITC